MLRYRIARFLLALGLPLAFLAACSPIQPIVRDGAGNILPVNNAAVRAVVPIGFPGVFTLPLDAAPDPRAETVYIVGQGQDEPGLFQAPWAGGDVTPVAVGAPFADPLGVAVSLDGATVYVADPKTALGQGAILAVDPATGAVATVEGTTDTAPRGLEVASVDGIETLYFTGGEQDSGRPAVYRIPTTGGTAELIAAGSPLVEPVGIAVAADGTVYVADRLAGGDGLGAVFSIHDGQVVKLADGFRTGDRVAGATLTLDDGVLLVSAMAAERPAAQVLGIVLASGEKFVITKEVELHPGSGGVHRAHDVNVFAWADSAGSTGKSRQTCSPCVMRIETP